MKSYNKELFRYLLSKGVDVNSVYEEYDYVGERAEFSLKEDENTTEAKDSLKYKCTPLIHIIRTERMEYWDKDKPLEDLFKQNDVWIDPNVPDSDGKDVFMHLAILNEFELTKYVLKLISINYKTTKQEEDINASLDHGLSNGKALN